MTYYIKHQINKMSYESTEKTQSDQSKKNYKNKFYDFLNSPIANLEQIRSHSWMGFPDELRPRIWRLLLDYEPISQSIMQSTLKHKRSD